MRYCRAILILGVLATAYLAFTLVVMAPWPAAIIGIGLVLARVAKKKRQLFAHGTARWCDTSDLERAGMLDAGSGLILGRVNGRRPGFWASLNALFDGRVPSAKACEHFVLSMRKAAPPPAPALVRLNRACHVMAVAPTGVGKGVSLVIPFLLDCQDSVVVIDPKGENAKLTAEHRRRMGQRVVVRAQKSATGWRRSSSSSMPSTVHTTKTRSWRPKCLNFRKRFASSGLQPITMQSVESSKSCV